MPGAENLDGGEGGADYGELGGVLRDAGDRRKRPAWVVVVAAARIAWARGRGGEPVHVVISVFFVANLIRRRIEYHKQQGLFCKNEMFSLLVT